MVNKKLFELVSSSDNAKDLDLNSVMEVLRQYLAHSSVNTKVAVLRWIHHLFTEIHDEMADHAVVLFPVLLSVLSDGADEVVLQGLEVLAEIVKASDRDLETKNMQYRKLLISLLNLFNEDKTFLENSGSLIIRQLCVLLNAELIFRTFADIIMEETMNIRFASTMVRALNLILLTSPELFELRSSLRNITNQVRFLKSSLDFVVLIILSLFSEICFSIRVSLPVLVQLSHFHVIPVLVIPVLPTCLSTRYSLVSTFIATQWQRQRTLNCQSLLYSGNLEITMEFLVEIDKLVQLIESPIFACKSRYSQIQSNRLHP